MPQGLNLFSPTGDAVTDAQHDDIQRSLERLREAKSGLELRLHAMGLYQKIREHFWYEERLMIQLKYPEVEAHRAAHAQLIQQLKAITLRISGETPIETLLEEFIAELSQVHSGTLDVEFAAYVALRPQ